MPPFVFSLHALDRVYERLSLTYLEIQELFDQNKVVPIGEEDRGKIVHYLFYSIPDQGCFVLVCNKKDNLVITVKPDHTRFAVSDHARAMAESLAKDEPLRALVTEAPSRQDAPVARRPKKSATYPVAIRAVVRMRGAVREQRRRLTSWLPSREPDRLALSSNPDFIRHVRQAWHDKFHEHLARREYAELVGVIVNGGGGSEIYVDMSYLDLNPQP